MSFSANENFDADGKPVITIISPAKYCPQCEAAVNLLKQQGVEFGKLFIEQELTIEEFQDIGAASRTFPVVFHGDREIVGQQALMKLVMDLKKSE